MLVLSYKYRIGVVFIRKSYKDIYTLYFIYLYDIIKDLIYISNILLLLKNPLKIVIEQK